MDVCPESEPVVSRIAASLESALPVLILNRHASRYNNWDDSTLLEETKPHFQDLMQR